MRLLVLSIILTFVVCSTSYSLEPVRGAVKYTGGGSVAVEVQLYDFATSTNVYPGAGDQNLGSFSANASGIISFVVGEGDATWTTLNASTITNNYMLIVKVGGTVAAYIRLDDLLLEQGKYGTSIGTIVFDTQSNVTSNRLGSLASDDFVFGSDQLDYDSDLNHAARMFFDKSKGAFRAGHASSDYWDEVNVGDFSTVAGGYSNEANGTYSAVCGGIANNAVASNSFIGGGNGNFTNFDRSTIGGGHANVCNNSYAAIIGGRLNTAAGQYSVCAGGNQNSTSGESSFLGGGSLNSASAIHTVLVGGTNNTITAAGDESFIGGGSGNSASHSQCVIAGGENNQTTARWAIVVGGFGNVASEIGSIVVGGDLNTSSGVSSVVGGGSGNTSSASSTTVSGGFDNSATENFSTVSGGADNSATAIYSTVCGGSDNTASGDYSVVCGGRNSTSNGNYNFVFGQNVSPTVTENHRAYFFEGANSGMVAINREDADHPIHVGTDGSNGNGAHLTAGGTWTNGSSITFKDRFGDLDDSYIINSIMELPVKSWYYKGTDEMHIGPFAEDFYTIFGTGDRNSSDIGRYLSTIDVAGVSLRGVQILITELEEMKSTNSELKEENEELRNEIEGIKKKLSELSQRLED
jgi:hypothetical protein